MITSVKGLNLGPLWFCNYQRCSQSLEWWLLAVLVNAQWVWNVQILKRRLKRIG